MKRILDDLKPEAAYFTDIDGHRSGLLIIQMEDTAQIPAVAEPWFLTFNADVDIHPVMLPEDLAKGRLVRSRQEVGVKDRLQVTGDRLQ
jgi:hypothetical protein